MRNNTITGRIPFQTVKSDFQVYFQRPQFERVSWGNTALHLH